MLRFKYILQYSNRQPDEPHEAFEERIIGVYPANMGKTSLICYRYFVGKNMIRFLKVYDLHTIYKEAPELRRIHRATSFR